MCDIFANGYKVFLKAHPGDKSNYNKTFENQIIIDKEIPSELIRLIISRNFDKCICTFSSSIYSLIPFINEIYNVNDTIIEFKEKIFKLLILFELAKKLNMKIKYKKDSLSDIFNQYYNLKGNTFIYYNINCSSQKDMIIKNSFFDDANMIAEINIVIKSNNIDKQIKTTERLYIKSKGIEAIDNLIKFNFKLPLSRVHITAEIKYLGNNQ